MTDDLPDEPLKDLDVSVQSVGFDDSIDGHLSTAAASAYARTFAQRLERTIVTLDTSRYEAVEVITPRQQTGLGAIMGQPEIRLVEQGEPFAEELAEDGLITPPAQIQRYSADDVEAMRTYAKEALDRDELAPLERFVARQLDVADDDVTAVAKSILESLRSHADADVFETYGGDLE